LVSAVVCLGLLLGIAAAFAWDEPGHVTITALAFDSLPDSYPAWVRTPENRARLCYLSAEPDRWRGQKSPVLDHVNGPDHYLDVEDVEAYGMRLDALPRFRNEFIERITLFRANHPEKAPPLKPEKDKDHTQTIPGMLPYAIEELRWKISSSWSTLRTFEAYPDVATDAELAGARNDVIEWMGLLSHFVGDASQPLHLTRHHHGWVGANPNGYTVDHKFHQYVDGGVVSLHQLSESSLKGRLRKPTRFNRRDDWKQIAEMLQATFSKVEPLYQLEKTGDLKKQPGKEFIENCFVDGAANLAGLWIAAYESSSIDDYLANKLAARRAQHAAAPATAPSSAAGSAAVPGAGR